MPLFSTPLYNRLHVVAYMNDCSVFWHSVKLKCKNVKRQFILPSIKLCTESHFIPATGNPSILRVHIVDNDSFPTFRKMISQMIVCHDGSPTIQVGYSGGHALMFSLTNRNKMRKKFIMTKDRSIDRGHTSAATKNEIMFSKQWRVMGFCNRWYLIFNWMNKGKCQLLHYFH